MSFKVFRRANDFCMMGHNNFLQVFANTNFTTFSARTSQQATEANIQGVTPFSYGSRGLTVSIITNSLDGTTTYSLRINGASVNQTIVVAAGLTGIFEDITNRDNIIENDLIGLQSIALGTVGTINLISFSMVGFR